MAPWWSLHLVSCQADRDGGRGSRVHHLMDSLSLTICLCHTLYLQLFTALDSIPSVINTSLLNKRVYMIHNLLEYGKQYLYRKTVHYYKGARFLNSINLTLVLLSIYLGSWSWERCHTQVDCIPVQEIGKPIPAISNTS